MLQPRGGKLTPQALRGARRRGRRARAKPRPMPVRKPPTCAKNATPTSGWRNDSTPSTAWILLGVWFALQAVEGVLSFRHPDVGVAFFAHVGGFLTGMGLGFALARRPRRRAPRRA